MVRKLWMFGGILALAAFGAMAITAGAAKPQASIIRRYAPAGGVGLLIIRPESFEECRKRRTPVTITLRGGGSHLRIHTPRTCGGRWRKYGHVPGVRIQSVFWSHPDESGTTLLLLHGFHSIHREYRFRLRAKGRRLEGWVTVHETEAREEQIFEGSDAFVNYCINKGKEIRSSGGRLYCYRIVGERGYLKLHPHRW